MEKKKYEKPIVLDLNGNTASGGPLSCVPGGSAGGGDNTCVGGGSAGWYCSNGGNDNNHCTPCQGGSGVGFPGSCVPGGSPGMYCEGGSSGYSNFGCSVGPSDVTP